MRVRIRPEDRRRAEAKAAAAAEERKGHSSGNPDKLRTADELLALAAEVTERMHTAEDRKRAAASASEAQADRGKATDAAEGGVASALRRGEDRESLPKEQWAIDPWVADAGKREAGEQRAQERSDSERGTGGKEASVDDEGGRKAGQEGRRGNSKDVVNINSKRESGDSERADEVNDKQERRGESRPGSVLGQDEAGTRGEDRKKAKGARATPGGGDDKAAAEEPKKGKGASAWSRIKFFGKGKRGSGAGAGAAADGGNRTVLPPALQGYNLSWGVLDAFEASAREDALRAADAFRARRREQSMQSVRDGARRPLGAELVRARARDGLVIVTWASAAFLDFLANWVHHLALQEADNFLIGAAPAAFCRGRNLTSI